MKWLKRAIRNWLGLTEMSYPHRFVTLTVWRDSLLGVDGNGDIYRITMDYRDIPIYSLLERNPLEK